MAFPAYYKGKAEELARGGGVFPEKGAVKNQNLSFPVAKNFSFTGNIVLLYTAEVTLEEYSSKHTEAFGKKSTGMKAE